MLKASRVLCVSRFISRTALVIPIKNGSTIDAYDTYIQNFGTSFKEQLSNAGGLPKTGQVRTFYGASDKYHVVSLVGQCDKDNSVNEGRDEKKQNLRNAVALGVKSLNGLDIDEVDIATGDCALSAGEGASLSVWTYKNDNRKKLPQKFNILPQDDSFKTGLILGEAQNLARNLMELPSNLLTPTIFAENAEELASLGIKINVYDEDWIKEQKMNAFWSVAKGSSEPPKMVELVWNGTEDNVNEDTFCIVGKGVTFDSGGISIKPSSKMGDMRADMGGAAVTLATMKAVAQLKIPGTVVGIIPLAENMPGPNASKPGDVVTARNGKTIQIDNTDAEGRLLLCDALDYAAEVHKPSVMIDVATLTGAMVIALGSGATGVFCKNNELWNLIEMSGYETGDRTWRMPHYKHYYDAISPTHNADLNNTGGREAGSATAAAFLSAFVPDSIKWAHFDIAGVMDTSGKEEPYICKGMTGRPTRTLVKIIENFHT